jgi:hypothetical protein
MHFDDLDADDLGEVYCIYFEPFNQWQYATAFEDTDSLIYFRIVNNIVCH